MVFKLKNKITFNVLSQSILMPILLSILLSVSACGPSQEKIVQEQVSQKVAEFRKKYTAECQARFLAEAERLVDSSLLAEAKAGLMDSLSLHKPGKPVQPAPIPPIDSATVKPIF